MPPTERYIGTDLEAMSFARNYSNWIIQRCRPYLGERTAEVGAGCGNLSQLLLSETSISELSLYEPADNLYSQLVNQFSDDPRCRLSNQRLIDAVQVRQQYYDTVLYINVLEHIEDDLTEVKAIHEILNKDGYACIFVPALSLLYSDFDRSIGHFRRYNKSELRKLFVAAEFTVVQNHYVDLPGIIPWYLFFVLLGKHLDRQSTRLYDKIVIPFVSRIENLIAPPIGKNLLLIARK